MVDAKLRCVQIRELAIKDAYECVPRTFPDNRGLFAAPYQEEAFRATLGFSLHVAQVNHSISREGTIRGIHFADTPPGQAKYVYCTNGRLLDVVVDLRVGSPTFGQWDAVELSATNANAVYISEGLGHAFVALEDNVAMTYLCSTGYAPKNEHGISPFDSDLGLPWPDDLKPVVSDKDRAAPTFTQAQEQDLLPHYDACVSQYQNLRIHAEAPK